MLNPGAMAKLKEATPVIRLIEPMVTPTSRCAVVTISSLGRLTMGTVHLPARLPTVTLPRAKSRVTDGFLGGGKRALFVNVGLALALEMDRRCQRRADAQRRRHDHDPSHVAPSVTVRSAPAGTPRVESCSCPAPPAARPFPPRIWRA